MHFKRSSAKCQPFCLGLSVLMAMRIGVNVQGDHLWYKTNKHWMTAALLCLWWRHQMGTFSGLLAICAGNSPASCEFPAQKPVTRSFDAFLDLCLNKRLRKQSWGWWFETLSRPLWRHCNVTSSPGTKWLPNMKRKVYTLHMHAIEIKNIPLARDWITLIPRPGIISVISSVCGPISTL